MVHGCAQHHTPDQMQNGRQIPAGSFAFHRKTPARIKAVPLKLSQQTPF